MTLEQKKKILDAAVSLVCAIIEPIPVTDETPKTIEKGVAVKVEQVKEESKKQEEAIQKLEVVNAEKIPTKEEVRSKLGEAAERGISVRDIITPYIPEGKVVKFSNVPNTAYVEVLKELEKHA